MEESQTKTSEVKTREDKILSVLQLRIEILEDYLKKTNGQLQSVKQALKDLEDG